MTRTSGGVRYPACGPPVRFSVHLASSAVTPQIQGLKCGAYMGALEEIMCVVYVSVIEEA